MKQTACLIFALLLALPGTPVRADERYAFDKKHSSILFSIDHLGFSQVTGTFDDYDGDFIFCIQHPYKDNVAVTLYTSGIHTPDEWMDRQLRGPDFFNAEKFPRMRFVSTKVAQIDKDNASVTGNLTLLGITKPVTLNARFTEKEYDPKNGDYVVSFLASGVINRSDFGMNYLLPVVGDEVHLHIQVKGVEEEEKEEKRR